MDAQTLKEGDRATLIWTTLPGIFRKLSLVLIGVALFVQAGLPILRLQPPQAYLAVAVTAVGAFLAYKQLTPFALPFLVAGPICAAVLGVSPVGFWSITSLVAFYLTAGGASALLVGGVCGAANFLAGALFEHGWFFTLEPTPAIAGLSAVTMAAIGAALRAQQLYWLEFDQRMRDALANRERAVSQGIAKERMRIARDLHDSVGHNIAVANMRIGSAEVKLQQDPDSAREQLENARESLQSVLAELQKILRVLCVEDDSDRFRPTPNHRAIPELAESFTDAGLDLSVDFSGLDAALTPDVSVAAYRITQELLTNAQKHGTGTTLLKAKISPDGHFLIESSNGIKAEADSSGGGNGILGMRERAASAGGRITVENTAGTFTVRAEFPAGGPPTYGPVAPRGAEPPTEEEAGK